MLQRLQRDLNVPGEVAIKYIGSRVLQAQVTLVLFMVILFVATRAAGDPALLNLPADATPAQIQMARERIGTDRSYIEQFGIFVRDMATLNFGRSIVYREPVLDLIGGRITASLKLHFASLLLILVTAFPLGVYAAAHRGKLVDHLVRLVAALSQAAPSFWVGLVLMAIFSVKLGWLPAGGIGTGGIEFVEALCFTDDHDVAAADRLADAPAAVLDARDAGFGIREARSGQGCLGDQGHMGSRVSQRHAADHDLYGDLDRNGGLGVRGR